MITTNNLFFNADISQYLQTSLAEVREELIISTATFKDMRLPLIKEWYGLLKDTGNERKSGITSSRNGNRFIPLLNILKGLRVKGIRIMILSSSEGCSVRKRLEFESSKDWMRICPRNHQKFVLIDGQRGFLTSANLTGSGMGLHHQDRRNFESAVILTSTQVQILRGEFQNIWNGKYCNACRYMNKKTCYFKNHKT